MVQENRMTVDSNYSKTVLKRKLVSGVSLQTSSTRALDEVDLVRSDSFVMSGPDLLILTY